MYLYVCIVDDPYILGDFWQMVPYFRMLWLDWRVDIDLLGKKTRKLTIGWNDYSKFFLESDLKIVSTNTHGHAYIQKYLDYPLPIVYELVDSSKFEDTEKTLASHVASGTVFRHCYTLFRQYSVLYLSWGRLHGILILGTRFAIST